MKRLVLLLVAALFLSCSAIEMPHVRVKVGVEPTELTGENRIRFVYGSGFFVSRDGIIITAEHVVDDAKTVSVYHEGRKNVLPVTLIHRDPASDLAVMRAHGVRVRNPLKFCSGVMNGESLTAHAWRGYGRELTRGKVIGKVSFGLWVANIMVGPGFSGGAIYSETQNCVAGATSMTNGDSMSPEMLLIHPSASPSIMRVLKHVAPESVREIE